MEYRIDCACGSYQMIRETAAGMTLACGCGKSMQVPKLSELRKLAGLSNHVMSPEATIEFLLIGGKLPIGTQCAYCGAETASTVTVNIDCSPPIVRVPPFIRVMRTVLFAFSVVFSPWILLFPREEIRDETATLVLFPLPLLVCLPCQPAMNDPATIKRCLAKDADCRRLLAKHPDAKVALKMT